MKSMHSKYTHVYSYRFSHGIHIAPSVFVSDIHIQTFLLKVNLQNFINILINKSDANTI